MPIATLQRSMRELGRIRTGTSRPGRGGKKVPTKLETFRLTSSSRELVEHAAAVFGGTVEPWEDRQFEVITDASSMDIVIPPGELVSQWFELWSGGGCVRRCDGNQNVLSMGPCECPSDPVERNELAGRGEACKPTTRLRVMLPAVPDIGVWRLESHGYYAAVELTGVADVLAAATQRGILIPARLRLDQRTKKVPGRPTNQYVVPVIELYQTRMADLVELPSGGAPVPRLGAGGPVAVLEPPRMPPPAGSDFRAPVDLDAEMDAEMRVPTELAAIADAVAAGGPEVRVEHTTDGRVLVDGAPAGDHPASDGIELTELGRAIRDAHRSAAGQPWAVAEVTGEQRRTLEVIFEGMAGADVGAGASLVFGRAGNVRMNAGEAASIIAQLVNVDPAGFRHAWRMMLEAVR